MTVSNLPGVLNGNIDDLIANLLTAPSAIPQNELRLRRDPGVLTSGSASTCTVT